MKRMLSCDLIKCVGKKVRVCGWLHQFRLLGKIGFIVIRDRSGLIQAVVENKEDMQRLKGLYSGSVLEICGVVATAHDDKGERVEIVSPEIAIQSKVTTPPPIEYYKPQIQSDLDFILDHRSLSLRNEKIQAVFKIQAELVHAFRLYMHDHVCAVEYFGPNILGTSSEGGAESFHIDYFGYNATLAQSSQLYKQVMVGVNERVFALMPFFRAEPSHTSRHLSEGKQFEFEMGFFDHWHEILDVQEGCLKYMLQHIHRACGREIELLQAPLARCVFQEPFPRISFAQAQQLVYERTGVDERRELDLSGMAERELCAYAREKAGSDFIFVTDWKREKRPFYSQPSRDDPTLTNTFDLLCAGTEITSGGERCSTLEAMVAGLKSKEMDPSYFSDYLQIFEFGMPRHGGFGMGLERLTMTLLGLKNIREASLFPSDPKRIASHRIKARIVFGGEEMRNEIVRKLHAQGIDFVLHTHEKTPPQAEQTAQIRNTPLDEGIKALIVRGKQSQKNYQFNLPADCKLDMKQVSSLVLEKCEMEAPSVILERYGLEIGAIPPFGTLLNLETFFDVKVFTRDNAERKKCSFNCGLRTESISMRPEDLLKVVDGKVVECATQIK